MNWAARVPSSLDYFAALVAQDEGFPLLEATAAVALDEYPELDIDRKSTRLNSSHIQKSRMPSSA